eukprot:g7610.t1
MSGTKVDEGQESNHESKSDTKPEVHSLNVESLQIEPVSDHRPSQKLLDIIKAKLIKHYLPLGFLFVLIVALIFPYPGKKIKSWEVGDYKIVDTINVAIIFIISGLTLKTEDVLAALSAFPGLIYGLVAILFLTPCLGFILIRLPLNPDEFTIGLAIFAAVPTTLTSGVTLVTQSYGNGTLALMLTVVSNLVGILTVPFAIKLIVASGTSVEINAVDLLTKLALTILLPLIIGKIIRDISTKVQRFVKEYKVSLSLFSSTNLICIVWQNLSESRDELIDQSAKNIIIIIVAGVSLHLVFLMMNYVLLIMLKLELPEWKAVLLMASQKTLPVSVTVISYLDQDQVGDSGLITIPCIIGHISQLFIDAFIVSRWATKHLKDHPDQ